MRTKATNPDGGGVRGSRIVIAAIAISFLMIASVALISFGDDKDSGGEAYVLGAPGSIVISSYTNVEDLMGDIQDMIDGMDADDTLTVTGSLSNLEGCLTLDIGEVNILWRAEYEASVESGNVLEITSDGGWFCVDVDGSDVGEMTLTGDIKMDGSYASFYAYGGGTIDITGNVLIDVTGGAFIYTEKQNSTLDITGNVTVTATGSVGISAADPHSTLDITGNLSVTTADELGISAEISGELTITGTVTLEGDEVGISALTAGKLTIDGSVSVTATDGDAVVRATNTDPSGSSKLDITGNVNVTGVGAYVYTQNTNSTLDITGNVSVTALGDNAEVYANNAGKMTIDGNVSVTATDGDALVGGGPNGASTLDITGNVSVTATGGDAEVYAVGSTGSFKLTIDGSVTATGDNAEVSAMFGNSAIDITGSVTMNATDGNVSVNVSGVNSKVDITGNVIAKATGGTGAIHSENNGKMAIEGNVSVTGDGVEIYASGTANTMLDITGNVSVTSTDDASVGASNDGKLTIKGNVSVTSTNNAVVNTDTNGKLTIKGNVTLKATGDDAWVAAISASTLDITGDVTAALGVYLAGAGLVVIDGELYVADLDECVWAYDGSGYVPYGTDDLAESSDPSYEGYLYFDGDAAGELYVKNVSVPAPPTPPTPPAPPSEPADDDNTMMIIIIAVVALAVIVGLVYFFFLRK
ncbi:MAG: hypothetical protein FWH44_03540 [Methanomassiliicoccaceae archaeon]|nr:hypothetical protein [Methanomassiliicoccaceae archaeon]